MTFVLTLSLAIAESPESIIKTALEQQQIQNSIQHVEMTIQAKNGATQVRTFTFKVRKEDEIVYSKLKFESPSDIAGTTMILEDHPDQQDPQVLYMPALERIQRISGRARNGAFMGSDFLYSDLEYSIDGSIEHQIIEDSETNWVILTTLPESEQYPYRRTTIIKVNHQLQKVEFLNSEQEKLRTLLILEVETKDTIRVPIHSQMKNHKKGTQTDLKILDISVNVSEDELPLSEFSIDSLKP